MVDGSGDELERIPLDPSEPVVLTAEGLLGTATFGPSATVPDEEDREVFEPAASAEYSFGIDTYSVSMEGGIYLGRRPCVGAPNGTTPPLLSFELQYGKVTVHDDGTIVRYRQAVWVGVELLGSDCLWVGGPEGEGCTKIEECRAVPRPTITDDRIDFPFSDIFGLVSDLGSAIVEEVVEFEIPDVVVQLLAAVLLTVALYFAVQILVGALVVSSTAQQSLSYSALLS